MLISCVAYEKGQKIADIPPEQIHEYVHRPGCFVWVALHEPHPDALEQMQREFGLHPLAVEDARNGNQRPKIEDYGNSLFAILPILEVVDGELRLGEMDVFVGPNYVLSVRSHAQRSFQDVRARAEREPELLAHGAGYVFYALMDAVVDRYFPVLHDLERELEQLEERIFERSSSPRSNIEAIYDLKQRLMTVKHAIAPLLEAVTGLTGARVPPICTGLREYFRDIYDHLLRLNQTVDSDRETLTTAIAVNLGMIQVQESETMKRLAAYAALVAVPTLIAGIYGMNFAHMPELGWRFGYGTSLGVMAGLDAFLFYKFRKAGWL